MKLMYFEEKHSGRLLSLILYDTWLIASIIGDRERSVLVLMRLPEHKIVFAEQRTNGSPYKTVMVFVRVL